MLYRIAACCVVSFALHGCGSLDKTLENRVVFTPQCERGFVASLYWKFGLTSEIAPADVSALCKKEQANAPK